MDKDNRLKISLTIVDADHSPFTIIGSLKIDGNVKHIRLCNNTKVELEKYIKKVFQYAKPLSTKDKYKYSDILDYDTYNLRLTMPDNSTLLELLEAYAILSEEYNNTDWTNFCCNNVNSSYNIFCNNCNLCMNCVYCNKCYDCNDCKNCYNCNDCIKCTNCNDCDICNECIYVNSRNNCYKIININ